MHKCVIVIPARMGATRFPGKPLVDLLGKPMVQWVYEAAQQAGIADKVLVATPDQEIVDRVADFGGEAILTRHDHVTGTDRIAEVAEKVISDVYVNVQGDEPLIQSSSIRLCAQPLLDDAGVMMGSVYSICPPEEYVEPATVKVVTDLHGDAMYFSRAAIPFERNPRIAPIKKHVGLYAYRRQPLLDFATWPMGITETAESLEQLRFMENGVRIRMVEAEGTALAIDLPEHADRVRELLSSKMK